MWDSISVSQGHYFSVEEIQILRLITSTGFLHRGCLCELTVTSVPESHLTGNQLFSSPNWMLEPEIIISASALLRTVLLMLVNSEFGCLGVERCSVSPICGHMDKCFQVISSVFWRPQMWHFPLSLVDKPSGLTPYRLLGMPDICHGSPYLLPTRKRTTGDAAFGQVVRNCCVKDSEAHLWGGVSRWHWLAMHSVEYMSTVFQNKKGDYSTSFEIRHPNIHFPCTPSFEVFTFLGILQQNGQKQPHGLLPSLCVRSDERSMGLIKNKLVAQVWMLVCCECNPWVHCWIALLLKWPHCKDWKRIWI